MPDSNVKSVFKNIGEFKLKSLIPFFVGMAIGYLLHEYFHDAITLIQIKELIDYIADTWQKF